MGEVWLKHYRITLVILLDNVISNILRKLNVRLVLSGPVQ
jgi:hypothetical protein